MSYFNFKGIIKADQHFILEDEDASHVLQSRRINTREIIEIQDDSFNRWKARVEEKKKKSLILMPIERIIPPPESGFHINLFQAQVKEKSLDIIIQKATELGTTNIIVFQSHYSQPYKSGIELEKKLVRWRKIAMEACKQSGRLKPPTISFLSDFSKLVQRLKDVSSDQVPTICFESSGKTIRLDQLTVTGKELNLLIGPEGGWDDEELELLVCEKVHLGPRILRAETAAISAISIIQYLFGDLREKAR
ncbi:16S rRNA (uracil(1498)-N(3))-methyltransferase [bacterium]|nr:16S rRNA (uracil(1498)-N(3))-methyltransferase [bacterium]